MTLVPAAASFAAVRLHARDILRYLSGTCRGSNSASSLCDKRRHSSCEVGLARRFRLNLPPGEKNLGIVSPSGAFFFRTGHWYRAQARTSDAFASKAASELPFAAASSWPRRRSVERDTIRCPPSKNLPRLFVALLLSLGMAAGRHGREPHLDRRQCRLGRHNANWTTRDTAPHDIR